MELWSQSSDFFQSFLIVYALFSSGNVDQKMAKISLGVMELIFKEIYER